jgi:hypothetical protein
MKIIGCDFHPSYQQIVMLDQETGEWTERKLVHAGGDAQRFYESLRGPVRVGMEAEGWPCVCNWMLRTEKSYAQLFGGRHVGQPESSCGRGQRPAA